MMTLIRSSGGDVIKRHLRIAVGAFVFLLIASLPCHAADCNTDCKKKCWVSVGCLTSCEVEKKKACAKAQADQILPVPLPPNAGPIIIGPGDVANPKQLFEEVKDKYNSACASPFRSVTKPVKLGCSIKAKKFQRDEIDDSIEMLVATGLFQRAEFDGVEIRWCPLAFGDGIAHEPNLVLLSDRLKDYWLPHIAAQLGHEMIHVREWRENGAEFPCKYSEAMVSCGCGTQPENRFEKPAYEMFDRVIEMFLEPARACRTVEGAKCPLASPITVGMACSCGAMPGRGAP